MGIVAQRQALPGAVTQTVHETTIIGRITGISDEIVNHVSYLLECRPRSQHFAGQPVLFHRNLILSFEFFRGLPERINAARNDVVSTARAIRLKQVDDQIALLCPCAGILFGDRCSGISSRIENVKRRNHMFARASQRGDEILKFICNFFIEPAFPEDGRKTASMTFWFRRADSCRARFQNRP